MMKEKDMCENEFAALRSPEAKRGLGPYVGTYMIIRTLG